MAIITNILGNNLFGGISQNYQHIMLGSTSLSQEYRVAMDNIKTEQQIKAIEEPKYKAIVPRNCIDEDSKITQLDQRIAQLAAEQLKSVKTAQEAANKTEQNRLLNVLKQIRTAKKLDFVNWNCVNEIEKTKLVESKDILSQGLDQYDEDVLTKSQKKQNTMLVVGGAIILIGLLITIKFTQK